MCGVSEYWCAGGVAMSGVREAGDSLKLQGCGGENRAIEG
jgi:hypothetical protein